VDNWSVYVVDGFDSAQPSGDRVQSLRDRSLSEVEGNGYLGRNSNMAHMYILECVDGSYYTGSTKDLVRRLWQHQNGLGARHTAKRLPVKLVYCEFYDRVADAFAREKQVQGWTRKKKEALIAGDTNLLHEFAACQNESHHSHLNQSSSLSVVEGTVNEADKSPPRG
jgi:putative endonuclease